MPEDLHRQVFTHASWTQRRSDSYTRLAFLGDSVLALAVTCLLYTSIPFGLGYALTGTLTGALLGLLWGGAVRILVLHHVTFSINSLCHFFGRCLLYTSRCV